MRTLLSRFGIHFALALACGGALAAEALPASDNPALEARVMKISSELRCLVCQNETIAASHADLAVDLRRQVREMLQNGQNEQQVIDYMTARYGDFVLYRPPFLLHFPLPRPPPSFLLPAWRGSRASKSVCSCN